MVRSRIPHARFSQAVPFRLAAFLLVAVLAAAPALPAAGQNLTLPRVSPHATVSQTVGLTEISVDYHRPSANDRTLWGGLVPYGAVWRAGANENTLLTVSHDVTIEGEALPAGSYGVHMVPGEDSWKVAFSSTTTAWGSFTYDESEDVLRVAVEPEAAPVFAEQLHYDFSDVGRDSATLNLHWGDLRLPLAIGVDTDAVVVATLQDQLRGIAQYNAQSWQQAAGYLAQNEVDDELALEWAERSVGMQPGVVNLSLQARLQSRLGRDEAAAASLARAEGMATTESQVNILGYMYLQAGDTAKAIETFQRNVDDHPDSWNVYDSLGEGYAAAGRTAEAVANYRKALEMAPEAQQARIQGILSGLADGGAQASE